MSIIEHIGGQVSEAVWHVIGRGATLVLRKPVLFVTGNTVDWAWWRGAT
jgi:hypothetical protein